jgi:hypothetical protein
MEDLLQQLRFEMYRLEVLKDAGSSPVRDAAILSAASSIDSVVQSIRDHASTPCR